MTLHKACLRLGLVRLLLKTQHALSYMSINLGFRLLSDGELQVEVGWPCGPPPMGPTLDFAGCWKALSSFSDDNRHLWFTCADRNLKWFDWVNERTYIFFLGACHFFWGGTILFSARSSRISGPSSHLQCMGSRSEQMFSSTFFSCSTALPFPREDHTGQPYWLW